GGRDGGAGGGGPSGARPVPLARGRRGSRGVRKAGLTGRPVPGGNGPVVDWCGGAEGAPPPLLPARLVRRGVPGERRAVRFERGLQRVLPRFPAPPVRGSEPPRRLLHPPARPVRRGGVRGIPAG